MSMFYQIGVDGRHPSGALFRTKIEAEREVGYLRADDRREADLAMREAGYEIKMPEYKIHEVTP